MSNELAAERPDLDIVIHAINDWGEAFAVEALYEVGDLAVLQDDETAAVWTSWEAEWRDVTILDTLNEAVYTYNTQIYTLEDPDVYAALKEAFIAVAEGRSPPPSAPLQRVDGAQ